MTLAFSEHLCGLAVLRGVLFCRRNARIDTDADDGSGIWCTAIPSDVSNATTTSKHPHEHGSLKILPCRIYDALKTRRGLFFFVLSY